MRFKMGVYACMSPVFYPDDDGEAERVVRAGECSGECRKANLKMGVKYYYSRPYIQHRKKTTGIIQQLATLWKGPN
jgi:hypothetical protein